MAPSAGAFFIDDWINGVKKLVGLEEKPAGVLSIKSDIKLANNGDVNKNNQIDSGDIIVFTYDISNLTKKEYKNLTLKTNIPRQKLNFVHNVKGTTGIHDSGKTLDIPNISILPEQFISLSFNARINYNSFEDQSIFTDASLESENKQQILKDTRKEVKALKNSKDKLPFSGERLKTKIK